MPILHPTWIDKAVAVLDAMMPLTHMVLYERYDTVLLSWIKFGLIDKAIRCPNRTVQVHHHTHVARA